MAWFVKIALMLGIGLLAGCATVVRGNVDAVQFVSMPSGAQVRTTLGTSCVTPCALETARRDAFSATFTLNGDTRVVRVDTRVSGGGAAAGAGNILAGGIIGVAVDAGTGANLNHVPNPVFADFTQPAILAQEIAEAYGGRARNGG